MHQIKYRSGIGSVAVVTHASAALLMLMAKPAVSVLGSPSAPKLKIFLFNSESVMEPTSTAECAEKLLQFLASREKELTFTGKMLVM